MSYSGIGLPLTIPNSHIHPPNNYTVLVTDVIVGLITVTNWIITLPDSVSGPLPGVAQTFVIKDYTGYCSPTNNITISTLNGALIDGLTSYVIDNAWSSVSLFFDGTNYFSY